MRPVLFYIGSLPLRSYGLLIAVAFLVGIWIGRRRAAARGYKPDTVIDLSVILILTSIAGARLAYVLVRWSHYQNDIAGIFRTWEGGLALYGGMVAGTIAALLFFRRRGIDIWAGSDLLTPSLAAGVAIGRIGCFLNGCCFGHQCDAPWGVVFSADSMAGMTFPGVHLHPTQVYEAAIALAILTVLLLVDRRRRFDGFLFWLFVILLSFSRIFIDPIRHYETESIFLEAGSFAMTNNQAVSVGLIVLAVYFLLRLSRRARASAPAGI